MKLKGRLISKLDSKVLSKMEKTLERMEHIRRHDDMHLRDLIKAKIEWIEEEKAKGHGIIRRLDEQIITLKKRQDEIRQQLVKLDGGLVALKDLLNEAEKLFANTHTCKEG